MLSLFVLQNMNLQHLEGGAFVGKGSCRLRQCAR